MTLALYGKSRRRQLTLLAIALFAVLAATTGGLSVLKSAFADRNPQSATVDGGSSTTVAPGATVSVSFTVELTEGSDWDSTSWGFDGSLTQCANTPNNGTDGVHIETFNITAPNTPGTYDLTLHARSNNTCSSGTTGGPFTLADAITVVAPYENVSATVDGGSQTTVNPGATVAVAFTVNVNNGDWEGTQWDIDDNTPDNCADTTDASTNGQATVNFNITAPNTPGTYDLMLRARSTDVCGGTTGATFTLADAIVVQTPQLPAPQVSNLALPDQCTAPNIHLLIDLSGSVAGSVDTMVGSVNSMITSVETALPGTSWRYTTFRYSGAYITSGNGAWVDTLAVPLGLTTGGQTPTANGIATAVSGGLGPDGSTDLNDPNGKPAILVIITDGDPNVPFNGVPTNYFTGSSDAIVQADAARTAGFRTMAIAFGPGDGASTVDSATVLAGLAGSDWVPGALSNNITVAQADGLGAALASVLETACAPDTGTLTIKKMLWDGQGYVANAANTWGFKYGPQGGDYATATAVNNGQTVNPAFGTYVAYEQYPAGYQFDGTTLLTTENGTCPATPVAINQSPVEGPGTQGVQVLLTEGQPNATVCFYNRAVPQNGNIYLDKVAANADPAGTEFALLVNGVVKANNSHAEGYEGPFSTAAGTVVVQEELLAGYEYGGVVCRLGAADGSVVTTAVDNSGGANRRGVSFTLAANTNVYCQFTNRLLPPPEITINAYKIVCDAEADLPNWGDGGANITATTAATFVDASGGDCRFVNGWAFEWSDGDVVNTSPGDNLNDTALADFTTTTSASDNTVPTGQTPASVTINISQYDKLWVREKKPAGYLNFSSDTTAPRDNVSAEFYCSADVINYDNWERIENTSGAHDLTAGTTYNCVAFNVDVRPGFIEVHKVVTNVVDDPTAFDFSFANPATNFTVVETDANGETRSANIGAQVVTEAPEAGYNTLGWARINGGTTCPAAMPTQVSGNVIEFGTDNTAEITIAPNNTTVLCFYNELDRGDITIEKYVWDGDSWEPHVAPAPFTFDINPIANIVPVHDNVGPGTYQVPAGEYAVIENLPVSGYEFQAIFEGDGVCPDSPLPNEPTQVLTDPFVNVEVPGGGDVLVCAYNLPVGRLIINKVNTTNDGPFTFDIDLDGGNFDTAVGGAAAGLTEVYNEVVPLGEYTVTEVGVGVFDQCPTTPGVEQIFQLNPSPVQSLTAPGQTITFTIINEECPVLLGTGTLVVEKYLDLNGIPGAEDTPLNWTVTVTGPEFPGGQAFQLDGTGDSPSVGVLVLPGIAVGPYTVTEATPSSYVQTGLFVNGIDMGINATAGVVVTLNETETVEFYNQPTGTVRVEKSTFVNGVAVDDRGGWTITVAGCGYFAAGVTNASGVVIFDDVPACANVTVQEDPNSKPGYTPTSGAAKVVSVTPNNTTVVTFRNEKNPPCIDCGPTPTPSTPTSTPTATPSATPTGTQPAGETPTPTPTESVAGEITPGTGAEATPIPPAAGTGTAGATSAIAMMLVVLGLFAISSGTTILAVARRRK